MMDHLSGPRTFLLAGSGHIAGVVNPPAAGKYQYWTGDNAAGSLEEFIASASETKGSWWPHWIGWIAGQDVGNRPATGQRVPGQSAEKAIEDATARSAQQRE